MTAATYHILLALADGDKHEKIGPGTLYGAIQRVLEEGWVEETEERPDPEMDDERRRYYLLTKPGRRALSEEAGKLKAMVAGARAKGLLKAEG